MDVIECSVYQMAEISNTKSSTYRLHWELQERNELSNVKEISNTK
jgi:hypothetical protein